MYMSFDGRKKTSGSAPKKTLETTSCWNIKKPRRCIRWIFEKVSSPDELKLAYATPKQDPANKDQKQSPGGFL